jgi:hypothetical protein
MCEYADERVVDCTDHTNEYKRLSVDFMEIKRPQISQIAQMNTKDYP